MIVAGLVILFIIIVILGNLPEKESLVEKEMDAIANREIIPKKIEIDMTENEFDTRLIVLDALNAIGCNPSTDEDDNVTVSYQGENFVISFGNGFTTIWDPFWSRIKATDPYLCCVREAINKVNFNPMPTVVLSEPDVNGDLWFHSHCTTIVNEGIENPDNFIKYILDRFLDIKFEMRMEYERNLARQQNSFADLKNVNFASNN